MFLQQQPYYMDSYNQVYVSVAPPVEAGSWTIPRIWDTSQVGGKMLEASTQDVGLLLQAMIPVITTEGLDHGWSTYTPLTYPPQK